MKLRYTLPALADLDSILEYIAAVSPVSAMRVQKRIQDVIELLPATPTLGFAPMIPSFAASPPLRIHFLSSTRLRDARVKVNPCVDPPP